jgi:hypothetical protein
MSTDSEGDDVWGLAARARALQEEMKGRLPELAEARRKYARARRARGNAMASPP